MSKSQVRREKDVQANTHLCKLADSELKIQKGARIGHVPKNGDDQ